LQHTTQQQEVKMKKSNLFKLMATAVCALTLTACGSNDIMLERSKLIKNATPTTDTVRTVYYVEENDSLPALKSFDDIEREIQQFLQVGHMGASYNKDPLVISHPGKQAEAMVAARDAVINEAQERKVKYDALKTKAERRAMNKESRVWRKTLFDAFLVTYIDYADHVLKATLKDSETEVIEFSDKFITIERKGKVALIVDNYTGKGGNLSDLDIYLVETHEVARNMDDKKSGTRVDEDSGDTFYPYSPSQNGYKVARGKNTMDKLGNAIKHLDRVDWEFNYENM
jgi:hypothetical protein